MERSPFVRVRDIFEEYIIKNSLNECNHYDFELIMDEIVDILNENSFGNIVFYIAHDFKKTKSFSKHIVSSRIYHDDDNNPHIDVYINPDAYLFFRKMYLKKMKNGKQFNIKPFYFLHGNKFFFDVVVIICHEIIYKTQKLKSNDDEETRSFRYYNIENKDEFSAFAHDAAIELYYKEKSKTQRRAKLLFDEKKIRKFNKKIQMFLNQIELDEDYMNTVKRR